MKLKSNLKICLLILGLLTLALVIVACGRTSVPGDRVNTIPHDVDWGFTNCLVCHTGGDIALPVIFHPTNPTNDDCLNVGCHFVEGSPPITTTTTPTVTGTTTPTVTGTTTPTVTTTEPPVTTVGPPPVISAEFHPPAAITDVTLCFICHVGEEGLVVDPWPAIHAEEGRANDSCLDADCHVFEQT